MLLNSCFNWHAESMAHGLRKFVNSLFLRSLGNRGANHGSHTYSVPESKVGFLFKSAREDKKSMDQKTAHSKKLK